MKLRNIFVAASATLVAIAIAAPAGAQLSRCKAKQNKKTGVIEYSFVNKAGGTVVYSYSDLDPAGVGPDEWNSFANEAECQGGIKGKRCVVSNDSADAAVAPAGCQIYMADLASGDKCALYIAGCQPGQRPLPTTGFYAIKNNSSTAAAWDAETGIAWHISPDNQPRSLADHGTHLAELNGVESTCIPIPDPCPPTSCLIDGCDLKLPTAHQLEHVAEVCGELWSLAPGGEYAYGGSVALAIGDGFVVDDICGALWPDPADANNCAWTKTVTPDCLGSQVCYTTVPGHMAVCLTLGGGGLQDTLVSRRQTSANATHSAAIIGGGMSAISRGDMLQGGVR